MTPGEILANWAKENNKEKQNKLFQEFTKETKRYFNDKNIKVTITSEPKEKK